MSIVYVGSRTTEARGGHGKGIGVFSIGAAGGWNLLQTMEQVNPSFLCLDRNNQFLYAIHGDESDISAYSILPDGTLAYLNSQTTGGTNPVHVCADITNRWLFVANLQTGSVSVLPRFDDGRIAAPAHMYFIAGNGGPGYISHPHQVQLDPTGDYLLVSAQGRLQGRGQVDVFKIDHMTGELHLTDVVYARTIAEPRHCVFHPSGKTCYGVNEKDYTVTQYAFFNGKLTPLRIVSTLLPNQIEEGWSSGIAILPSAKLLFTSDRKQNQISLFVVDEGDGSLHLMGSVSAEGRQPRFICVNPKGNSLIVANELSNTIYEFPIDSTNNTLKAPILRAQTGSPVCVVYKG